jgi:predicted lipoprotein with Yx(FWY)xxD motif
VSTACRLVRAAVTVTAAGIVIAGCGGDTGTPDAAVGTAAAPSVSSPEPAAPRPSPAESSSRAGSPSVGATGLVVKTADSEFGTMLFGRRGQAIYLFGKENTADPECYAECAQAWPPVLTDGAPRAAGDVRLQLLGTTPRIDGATQVTYAGHPLYYYAHEGPGEVLCHNIVEFGGRWLVVTPDGTPAA